MPKSLKIALSVAISILFAPWVVSMLIYSKGTPVLATIGLEALVFLFWAAFISLIWMVDS